MTRRAQSDRMETLLEALSDVSLTLVADFFAGDAPCGGLPTARKLAEIGVTVFPVGVVGEDSAGQQALKALQEHRVTTSGIGRLKTYATPATGGQELLHGEHPALLNIIDHARKFAAGSEAMYVCDYGIGAAAPRVLNFIKSNGCVREKALAARSLRRLVDFEQLTTAVASEPEIEQAIGIAIDGDARKLAVAGEGMMEEMRLSHFVAASQDGLMFFRTGHKLEKIAFNAPMSDGTLDLLGAVFAACEGTDAEPAECAHLAARVAEFYTIHPAKRARREELASFVKAPRQGR